MDTRKPIGNPLCRFNVLAPPEGANKTFRMMAEGTNHVNLQARVPEEISMPEARETKLS
jgi:hypothetical protein